MNDLIDGARISAGRVRLEGRDIYAPEVDVVDLRRRVGMVFQKSNPFPKSIYENVAYGLRVLGVNKKARINEAVEKSQSAEARRLFSTASLMRAFLFTPSTRRP